MNRIKGLKHIRDGVADGGNKFQQGLGIVGRNIGMGEGRTQCRWVSHFRKGAIRINPQAFFLYAAVHPGKGRPGPGLLDLFYRPCYVVGHKSYPVSTDGFTAQSINLVSANSRGSY